MTLDPAQELLERYGDQLRAKISSKFSASTFLAGFASTILGGLLSDIWSHDHGTPVLFPQVLALTVVATVLFFHGVVRLDELSMPKRFWPGRSEAANRAADVGLLTQDDLWALHDRMVFYWRYLTMSGTAATGIAFLVFILPQRVEATGPPQYGTVLWAASGALLAFLYARLLDRTAPYRGKLIRPID